MMTLDEFLSAAQRVAFPQRSYVREPGFDNLYVRYSRRLFSFSLQLEPCLDLANMVATEPGKGTLTRLVQRLRRDYPSLILYVESVLNPRLPGALARLGFIPARVPACFVLFPASRKTE